MDGTDYPVGYVRLAVPILNYVFYLAFWNTFCSDIIRLEELNHLIYLTLREFKYPINFFTILLLLYNSLHLVIIEIINEIPLITSKAYFNIINELNFS